MGECGSDPNVEYHDGDEQPVCVGQWCCGCKSHPIGKPWGWNHEAWERHREECPLQQPSERSQFERNIARACSFAPTDRTIISHENPPIIPPILADVLARLDQKASERGCADECK